jgi:hypothetical protein
MATDTALIRVMTRRYSSGLLNFAAHSPDNQGTHVHVLDLVDRSC